MRATYILFVSVLMALKLITPDAAGAKTCSDMCAKFIENKIDPQEETVQAQTEELCELKCENQAQTEGLNRLKSDYQAQTEELNELRSHNQAQTEELNELRSHNQAQTEELNELRIHNEAQTEELNKLKSDYQAQTEELNKLKSDYQDKCQCSPVGVSADIKNIPDRRITSSSVYLQYYPYQGRLNGQGGWCASTTSNRNDFIQVDMGAVRSVCAVATQGKTTGSYVESYKLLVSTDGVTWNTYKENNADKVFQANRDLNTIVRHSLTKEVQTRFVRFYPVTSNNYPCMRIEIFVR